METENTKMDARAAQCSPRVRLPAGQPLQNTLKEILAHMDEWLTQGQRKQEEQAWGYGSGR